MPGEETETQSADCTRQDCEEKVGDKREPGWAPWLRIAYVVSRSIWLVYLLPLHVNHGSGPFMYCGNTAAGKYGTRGASNPSSEWQRKLATARMIWNTSKVERVALVCLQPWGTMVLQFPTELITLGNWTTTTGRRYLPMESHSRKTPFIAWLSEHVCTKTPWCKWHARAWLCAGAGGAIFSF